MKIYVYRVATRRNVSYEDILEEIKNDSITHNNLAYLIGTIEVEKKDEIESAVKKAAEEHQAKRTRRSMFKNAPSNKTIRTIIIYSDKPLGKNYDKCSRSLHL